METNKTIRGNKNERIKGTTRSIAEGVKKG